MILLMRGDSPQNSTGVHQDLSVCAHLGVCIHAKLSRSSRFEHGFKIDGYVDHTESL